MVQVLDLELVVDINKVVTVIANPKGSDSFGKMILFRTQDLLNDKLNIDRTNINNAYGPIPKHPEPDMIMANYDTSSRVRSMGHNYRLGF